MIDPVPLTIKKYMILDCVAPHQPIVLIKGLHLSEL